MALGDQKKQSPLISVLEGLKIAAAAGVHVTAPTMRTFFKNSKSMTRFRHKIYMRRDEFLQTLNGMVYDGKETDECDGTSGSDGTASNEQNA